MAEVALIGFLESAPAVTVATNGLFLALFGRTAEFRYVSSRLLPKIGKGGSPP